MNAPLLVRSFQVTGAVRFWGRSFGLEMIKFAYSHCGAYAVPSLQWESIPTVGEWLSLVEHLVRDQGVGGSNPLSPDQCYPAWKKASVNSTDELKP